MPKIFSAKMGPGATIRMDTVGDATLERAFGKEGVRRFKKAFKQGVREAAKELKDGLKEVYRDDLVPGWAKLHPITVALKKHAKPLFDTGEMANAVTLAVVAEDADGIVIDVGLPRGKQSKKAAINEEGAMIAVTPERRNFFAAMGMPLKKTTNFLHIPPRPSRRPAIKKSTRDVEKAILRRLEQDGFKGVL